MMTGARNILWLLPVLLLVSAPAWWAPVTAFLAPRGDFAAAASEPARTPTSFVMDKVYFTQRRGGALEWAIHTARLSTVGSGSVMEMETVQADLFDQDRVKFHIVSNAGQYDSNELALTLSGDVRVTSNEGFTILSPLLRYFEKERSIKTDRPVFIAGRDMEIKGRGLVYNLATGAYTVFGRLKLTSR